MLSHPRIWAAIDGLAKRYGFSPSGLAKKSGLDPTTFNVSKRISRDGKPRWPSTESVSKVLAATGATLEEFLGLVVAEDGIARFGLRRIPVIGMAQAGEKGFFDDSGYPTGAGWDELAFPDLGDPSAYGLEVTGDSMAPVYRNGDIVIISPGAGVRRGDRVVVKTTEGEVLSKELVRRTAKRVELASLNPAHPGRVLELREVSWIARIVWVSQ
ncbi:MAG: helix-turn-helix transcriptional regulator [Alphaproteobacteria bacterium]|nr:helix-turn-helix transcriptional regulator [Alphaproteobacteria bacterium]